MKSRRPPSPLQKKARRGFRGYPVGTVAFYGPDDRRASKVAVGIIMSEGAEVSELKRWFSDEEDVRRDSGTHAEILGFLDQHGVCTIVMANRIIGCPHEEGSDYPLGQSCPVCPLWAGRDRWSGERLH